MASDSISSPEVISAPGHRPIRSKSSVFQQTIACKQYSNPQRKLQSYVELELQPDRITKDNYTELWN